MNILYFIPSISTSGGMERVLIEKANYLAETGRYTIYIVTTEMSVDEEAFFCLNSKVILIHLELHYNKIFENGFFQKLKKTITLNSIYAKKIEEILIENNIDICITMGGKELEFLGGLNVPCKKIYENHFNKNFRSSFLKANGKTNMIWKFFGIVRDYQHSAQVKKMDKVVVLTDVNFKAWCRVTDKVILISNPSPLINKSMKLPYFNSKRVIAIGKLDAQKGYDMLIDAWSKISKKYPDWRLDIFGQGVLRSVLEKQINNLNMGSTICLRGITKNVEKELFDSSFFVMSSRFEGLPMVLIESITCGLPIVSFDCETGPREIIVDNDCGILVKNGDVDQLALAIEKLIVDNALLQRMSDQALKKSSNYKLEHIMCKWDNLFQDLIGSI